MIAAVRTRLTFANLVACACLFVVLGGDAVAAGAAKSVTKLITGKDIKNNSVTGADVRNASLTGADLKDGSVAAADLAAGLALAGPKGDIGATGPKGDAGAKGETGPAGTPGAQGDIGAPGVSALEVVSASSVQDSTGYKQVKAACPPGKTAISGGSSVAASSQPAPLAVVLNAPLTDGVETSPGQTPNGWIAGMNEESATTTDWVVTAFVICAHVTS